MKILYFYQYFSTPKGAWGTRVYEFAKIWVEQGHEVTVITSIYSKSDISATKFIENQNIDGINLKILNIRIDNKQSFFKRIWTFLQYSLLSSWFAVRLQADIVIASSGPISAGIPGLVAKYIRGRKFIFEVRDLWPDGVIQLGIIKNPLLKSLSFWFERVCYEASSHIITLSPGIRDNIKKRYEINHVTSVTNAANIELFGSPSGIPLSPQYLHKKKYAIYTGNIGPVNNSEWLFNAARILKEKERDDILILLIGDGVWRKELEEKAKEHSINNFIIKGLMPKTELVAYVQGALTSLVPLKGTPILDTSSPNKFFESLAAGVPIVQNTNGWMKDFLEEHKVGFTISPEDSEALANLLVYLSDEPILVKEMGHKAKQVAITEFDKNLLSKKMLKVLESVNNLDKEKKVELSAVS